MKPNVPWSIKGIDPDARVVAKKAAKEAGMTLGEWLNKQIIELGNRPATEDDGTPMNLPENVVTVDQLHEVIDSLNRMNERLQKTEDESLQAFSGIHQGLTSVLERVQKVESTNQTGVSPDILQRLDAIEKDDSPRKYIDSFMALEQALRGMVKQLETTRDETLDRVGNTERALIKMDERIARIDLTGGKALADLKNDVDNVSDQLRQTEISSRKLMQEAQAAASSDDKEFIERTSDKLRALGTEIKRSGDQMKELEGQIGKLSEKIEGAEQRSAEGISSLAERIEILRDELKDFDEEQADVTQNARDAIAETTEAAQSRMANLQGSFEQMIARIEGKDPEQVPAAEGPVAIEDEDDGPIIAIANEEELADPQEEASTLQQAMQEAEKEMPDEEDFDEVFGEEIEESANDASDDDIEGAFFEDSLDAENNADQEAEAADGDPEAEKPGELTAKQKILLAERARRLRLEKEAEAAEEEADEIAEGNKGDTDTVAADTADIEDDLIADTGTNKIAELRKKYGKAKGGKLIPIAGAGIVGVAIIAGLGWFFFKGKPAGDHSELSEAGIVETTSHSSEPALTPEEQFQNWQTLTANAQSEEDQNTYLNVLRRAAAREYPPAQYALGEVYRTGTYGEDANPVMARTWLQAAAEGGNVKAMHKIGAMYAQGSGGEANESTAISWFEQAATYGFVDSIYNLALIYDPEVELDAQGTTAKDAEKAYYWYALAAKLGDEEAGEYAVELALTLPADARKAAEDTLEAWTPAAQIPGAN